ncbi:MAG: DUF3450 family protein [Pseudohongiella sp.]|nr:DUF3450 family protein [Pseudohongiella sp.]MDP2126355.1 DUF3450 family protein [Pseudohongiella sp.]
MKSLYYISRSLVRSPLARRPLAAAAVVLTALSSTLSTQTFAQTDSLQEQFQQANTALEALTLTNTQLRERIARQEQLIIEMAASIEHAALLADDENSPLNGLIDRMMSDIEQFVESDLPFELEARRRQVERIRGLIDNPAAPISQKLAMLISLYQAEGAYGRSLETYTQTMEVNGVEQEVTLTRIGRIMLAYQTADRTTTAVWDKETDQWVELSAGEYRTSLTRAMNVANGSLNAELINIPISAPVAAQ